MATEASILAVLRASRPNFKNPNDKIAFIIHAAFLSAGYSLIATGDKAFEENPPTDGEETGIDGWNSSEDGYAFVYVKSDNGEKKSVLVKCVAIGLALVVDVLNLKDDSKEPLHIQINVKDHVVEEDKHSNYGEIYKNLRGLVQILNTGIFNKLDTKSGSCSSTSSCSKGPGENHTNNNANVFPDERQQPPPVIISYNPLPAASRRRQSSRSNSSRSNTARPFVQTERFTEAVARCYGILTPATNVLKWEIIEIFRLDPSVLDVVESLTDESDLYGYMTYQVSCLQACRPQ